ncbi:MAG: NTP transferase domain-containing protein [Elusimicrobia bacterium]|nr:NTP transferase domain-containing protein [Elusimicrobiota bacterium]
MPRTVILVQARMGSDRLPGKVLAGLCGEPMLWHVMRRCLAAEHADLVMLCTNATVENDPLEILALEHDWNLCRGSSEALALLTEAAQNASAETVVRITADCPLIDPALIDAVVADFGHDLNHRLLATTPGWPDGLDVEVLGREELERANREAQGDEREHVTLWTRRHGGVGFLPPPIGLVRQVEQLQPAHRKWSVDTQPELDFVRQVMAHAKDASWQATVAAVRTVEAA